MSIINSIQAVDIELENQQLEEYSEVIAFAQLCFRYAGIKRNRQLKMLLELVQFSGLICAENAFLKAYRKFARRKPANEAITLRDCLLIIIALNLPLNYAIYLIYLYNHVSILYLPEFNEPDIFEYLTELCSKMSPLALPIDRFKLAHEISRQEKYMGLLPQLYSEEA